MKCPFCGSAESGVVDTRETKDGAEIRRRRICESCTKRFTTYERIEELMPMVVKKDGRRETFERMKILTGLRKACEKRPISLGTIERIVNEIEYQLQEAGENEISSTQVGEAVMRRLYALDQVAYVRFASVYRAFKDIGDFVSELKELQDKDPVG